MDESTKLINIDFNRCEIGEKQVKTINPPVYRASTILFDSIEDMNLVIKGKYPGLCYGTDRVPTQRELEESINLLEKSHITRIVPSGISAIRHVLLAFLQSGDHLIVPDSVYTPTKNMCKYFLPKFNIETTFVKSDIGEEIKEHIKENTKMIFLESPGSISFEFQDIEAIVKIAKEKEIISVIDNTWATPVFFKPIENGIDVSIESITKYISGNSDLLMGSISVNEKYSKIFDRYYLMMGICATGDECYRALKGIKTLKLRLAQHEKNGIDLASWIEKRKEVEQVIHPGLTSHPQHKIWEKLFKGSSGLFGFILKKEITREKTDAFVNSLKLFGKGFSWGGYKSLISSGEVHRDVDEKFNGKNIIRISTGLEDIDDLKKDLEEAFKLLK